MIRYIEPILGYAAVLDGDIAGADVRPNRMAAERDAVWLRNHPARHDRMIFGSGGGIKIIAVAKDEWTGELRAALRCA